MRRTVLVGLAGLVAGCATPTGDTAVDPGPFAIDPTPILTIGASEGDAALMFHQVHAGRRQPDGSLVVIDGGTHQVRWYDAAGAPLRTMGRPGQGPGEFRGMLSLLPWAGDSVAILDRGNGRLVLLGDDGSFARTSPESPSEASELPWRPWLARRTVVFGAPGVEARACVRAALRAMPLHPLAEGLRFLTMDDAGRLWMQEGPDSTARWSIWRRDGRPLGQADLPPTFHLLHAGSDFALGRVEADDATERVILLRISDPRDAGSCLPPDPADAPVEVDRNLMVHARNMFVVQEAMWADGSTYSMAPNPRMISIPEDVSFWMFEATRVGWVGGVIHQLTEQACVTAVGRTTMTGGQDGGLVCG